MVPNAEQNTCYDAYEVLVLFAFFIKHMGTQIGIDVDTAPLLVLAGLVNLDYDVYDDTLSKVEAIAKQGQAIGGKLTFDQVRIALDQAIIDRDEYIA